MPWLRPRFFSADLPEQTGFAAVSPFAGRVHAFAVRRGSNSLLHWWWDQQPLPDDLPAPQDLTALTGGQLRPLTPAAVSWGPDRIDVFGIGAGDVDGRLLHYWWAGGGWSLHVHAGAPGLLANCSPAAVAWASGRLDIFAVRNPDGVLGPRTLLHWWWDGSVWSGPFSHGGRLRDVAPCVVSWAPNHLDVFATGADENDGRPIHWRWDGTTWSGPTALAGRTGLLGNGGLAAASWGPGRVDVCGVSAPEYAFGPRYLRYWWFDGGVWHGPERDTFAGERAWLEESRPAISMPGPGRVEILATGNPVVILGARPIKRWNWDGVRWNGPEWYNRVGTGVSAPTIVARDADRLDVLVNGPTPALLAWDALYTNPSAPSDLTATVLRSDSSGSTIRLNWRDNSTTESSFRVESSESGDPLGSDAGFSWLLSVRAGITTAEAYIARSPGRHRRVRYRVFADDREGFSSPPSNQTEVGVSPAPTPTPPPPIPPPSPDPQLELSLAVGTGSVELAFGNIFPEASGFELVSSTGERHILTLGEMVGLRQFSQVYRRTPVGTEYWTVRGWAELNMRRNPSLDWARGRVESEPRIITWPRGARVLAAAAITTQTNTVAGTGTTYDIGVWRWL